MAEIRCFADGDMIYFAAAMILLLFKRWAARRADFKQMPFTAPGRMLAMAGVNMSCISRLGEGIGQYADAFTYGEATSACILTSRAYSLARHQGRRRAAAVKRLPRHRLLSTRGRFSIAISCGYLIKLARSR